MHFQYRAGWGSYLRWWLAKSRVVLLLLPAVLTLLDGEAFDRERLALSLLSYYLVYLIPLGAILVLFGLWLTLVSQLRHRQAERVISVALDEQGVCETTGERSVFLAWEEIRWIHIGRTYVDILGGRTILFVRKSDVGWEAYEALRAYLWTRKDRQTAGKQ